MSTASPLIQDWMDKKLKWRYLYNPKFKAFPMTSNQLVQLHAPYEYEEGTFIMGGFLFDHPSCGVRLKSDPNLDTERTHTIGFFAPYGNVTPNVAEWVVLPPTSAPGIYSLFVLKEWMWLRNVTLYTYNTDTATHYCLGFAWTMAVLEDSRPNPSRDIQEMILRNQETHMESQEVTPVPRDRTEDRTRAFTGTR